MSNSDYNKPKSESIGESDLSSTLRDAGEKIRDTAERLSSDAGPRVRRMMGQAGDTAGDFYERAQGWLNEGNNKTIGFVALIAVAGVLGFFIGRGMSGNERIPSDLRTY